MLQPKAWDTDMWLENNMSMMCEGDKIKDRVVDAVGRQEVIIREREKEANTILCGKVLTVEKQKKQKTKS